MTELLSKDPLEGMVLGERRIKLLTGISHILAKNYIYEGKNQMDEGDEIDDIYGGAGMKDSFMSEGILTLDFSLSWDNIELYDSKEFENLREKDYSDAKGAAPIARLCMEQPSKRTDCMQTSLLFQRKLFLLFVCHLAYVYILYTLFYRPKGLRPITRCGQPHFSAQTTRITDAS